MSATPLRACLLATALGLASLTGCGSSEEKADAPVGNETDRAFVNDMRPHHEMGVEMARVAIERAEHPELRAFAEDLRSSQQSDLAEMKIMTERYAGEGADGLDTFGLTEQEMGMDMHDNTLETTRAFDRTFLDMMVVHHEGAVMMSEMELESGSDPAARDLARRILDGQQREIDQMNEWRDKWFGPAADAEEMMDGG